MCVCVVKLPHYFKHYLRNRALVLNEHKFMDRVCVCVLGRCSVSRAELATERAISIEDRRAHMYTHTYTLAVMHIDKT